MGSDIAAVVENVGKCYHVHEKNIDRLKQALILGQRKLYREFWALRDISFEVCKGETLGIVGANGSGKSTLLQLMFGVLQPTAGRIRVEGRIGGLLELGAGFNPEETGRSNVLINASILGVKPAEMPALFWLRSVIESERYSRHLPRTVTSYDQLLSGWQGQIARIGNQLQIDWPKTVDQVGEAVADFIRPSSRHHHVENDEFLLDESIRDTLGAFLHGFWRSNIWRSARPAWLLARMLGKLDKGIDQLVPMGDIHRTAEGGWHGNTLPSFIIPTAPLIGWVRLRARVKSSVSSKACLYFDTGSAFHQREHFELAPVAGSTDIDRMVPIKKPTYLIRFDPIQAVGEFTLESFSLEPMSSVWFNTAAVLRNLRKLITGSGSHRPSIHESVSKAGTDLAELEFFKKTWAHRIPRDPFYNPNLTTHACDFRIG